MRNQPKPTNLSRRRFSRMMALGGVGLTTPGVSAWYDRGAALVHVRRHSFLMGSVATFDVVAPTERDGFEAINRAVRVFHKVESLLSMYREDSEIAVLERHAGRDLVPISEDTEIVLQFALEMSRQTEGRFDVTIEPLMRRWGFREDPDIPVPRPTEAELRAIQDSIGFKHLHLESGFAALARPGMALDLGGIAGGYALDQAIEVLRSSEIAAALINFSGDVHSFGSMATGVPWKVHLLNPVTGRPKSEPINLEGQALSTSGAYENRRHDAAGASWGHLLLPSASQPLEPFGSVTVLHPSAMMADAWSTAVFVGSRIPEPQLTTTSVLRLL